MFAVITQVRALIVQYVHRARVRALEARAPLQVVARQSTAHQRLRGRPLLPWSTVAWPRPQQQAKAGLTSSPTLSLLIALPFSVTCRM